TREMSASSLIPLIASHDLVRSYTEILSSCGISNQNKLHGCLVQLQYLMRGHLASNVAGIDIGPIFLSKVDQLLYKNSCELTRYLFLCIMDEFVFDAKWISGEPDKAKRE
ncbi:4282_t:CDS:2, partial [Acaulospora morrowiae]